MTSDFLSTGMTPIVGPGASGTVFVRKVSPGAYEIRLVKVALPASQASVSSPFPPTVTVDGTITYAYGGT